MLVRARSTFGSKEFTAKEIVSALDPEDFPAALTGGRLLSVTKAMGRLLTRIEGRAFGDEHILVRHARTVDKTKHYRIETAGARTGKKEDAWNTHPIIEALKSAGLKATYSSSTSTSGGEWHSPCPFCREETGNGGRDRLVLWPEKGNFFCRHGHKGNIAQVLAQAGMSLAAAQKQLGLPETRLEARAATAGGRRVARALAGKGGGDSPYAGEAVGIGGLPRAQRDYLQARGLRPETIQAARIGGCMETRYYEREAFGLVPEADPDTGKPRRVCVPEGILIPYRNGDGTCVKVQSRCDDDRYGRYRVLPGSGAGEPGCCLGRGARRRRAGVGAGLRLVPPGGAGGLRVRGAGLHRLRPRRRCAGAVPPGRAPAHRHRLR